MTRKPDPTTQLERIAATFGAAAVPFFGLALLVLVAPEYLTERGFPLDDAWIHLVYGRNFAESFTLAYNPGEAATGATSPMWAWLLALPHLVWSDVETIVAASKGLGFGLHCATTWFFFAAVRSHSGIRAGYVVALLVGLHPDLIAASVSGMEISLATAIGAVMLWSLTSERPILFGLCAAAAGLARPEFSIVFGLLAVFFFGWSQRRNAFRFAACGGVGSAVAWAGVAIRNLVVSSRPLPATFYAKAEGGEGIASRVVSGLSGLLPELTLFEWTLMTLVVTFAAGVVWIRAERAATSAQEVDDNAPPESRIFTTCWFTGFAYVIVSFVLIEPYDPPAFYHQRYLLPGLPFLVAGLAGIVWVVPRSASRQLIRNWAPWLIAGGIVIFFAVESVGRFLNLSNDAKNIDDVQVAVGDRLGELPDDAVTWIVDAGATRYFGNGYMVDLMGLNTFQVLFPGRETYFANHSPWRIELVNRFASLQSYTGDVEAGFEVFEPTTNYTVTSFPTMAPHAVMVCEPGESGVVDARIPIRFECANSHQR